MQVFEYDIPPFSIAPYFPGIPLTSVCFFDIETTGLSADTSSVYLIGCMYMRNGGWHLIQWFADDYNSEKELLTSFFQHLENYSFLVHYNGSSFDVPYLQKKCRQHHLAQAFPDTLAMVDLYKILRPYRPFMQLSHMRQKNLEEYLGISREDTFSGRELIALYSEYIQSSICKKDGADKLLSLLLLHNKEDIACMLPICTLLSYPHLFPIKTKKNMLPEFFAKSRQQPPFKNPKASIRDGKLSITFTLCYPFFVKEAFPCPPFSLIVEKNAASLLVSLTKDTLYFFYRDYKNYYYLPAEDTAIHKSVAAYVDTGYKEKATAATCYCKKTGTFAPCFSYAQTEVLYKNYKDRDGYVEISQNWLSSEECITAYLLDVLAHYESIFPI